MPPPTFARRAARLLPFFATLAASIAGLAESHAAGPDFSLGLHLVHHRVDERAANGAHLLTETGWTPMLVARLTQPLPLGRLDAHLSWNDGSLDYDGRSQTGSRFKTTTDQRIWRTGFGYALPIAPTLDLRARWELEDRRRHIQGRGAVAGLDERYRQHYAALGLIWTPAVAPAGTTFSAEWIAGLGGLWALLAAALLAWERPLGAIPALLLSVLFFVFRPQIHEVDLHVDLDLPAGSAEFLSTMAGATGVALIPGNKVTLSEPEAHAWLGTLNDLRLALGSRLEITEENHRIFQELPDGHPAAAAYHLYDWLSYLQETLVRAVMGFDVDYPDPPPA